MLSFGKGSEQLQARNPAVTPTAASPYLPAPPRDHAVASAAQEKQVVADEALRFFLSRRWTGPIGCSTLGSIVASSVWSDIPQSSVIAWWSAVIATSLAMVLAFAVPAIRRRRAPNGLPWLSLHAHFAVGALFGGMFLLHHNMVDDPVLRWIALAASFALSAGVANGLSGLSALSMLCLAPCWVIASAVLLYSGQWMIGAGGLIFLGLGIFDQMSSGSMWRELVKLRLRSSQQAEANEWRATHDELTGLLNRAGILEELERSRDSATTAMYLDLDHFKEVNDRFGHLAGDVVLRLVAQRLRGAVRVGDSIARVGGDEFFILLGNSLTNAEASALGDELIAVLEEPFSMDEIGHDGEVWISASIGYTMLNSSIIDPSRLMVEADHALLQAKRRGRRQVAQFTPLLEAELDEQSGLESSLRKAVRSGGITAAAQPMFDLETGQVTCVELLARWRLDSGVMVPPSVFIPLAESAGLMDELTLHMLRQAGEALTSWRANPLLCDAKVSVNVSPIQLLRSRLLDVVVEAMEEHQIRPRQLMLELTESSTVSDVLSASELFGELRNIGVDLAIDDFGTGYSSLGHLLSLPVYAVKLDRSLIASLGTDPRQRAVFAAVRDLAAVLGQDVVAEGVETTEQIQALTDMGIRAAQGFGLCRPVPPAELVEQLGLCDWYRPAEQRQHAAAHPSHQTR